MLLLTRDRRRHVARISKLWVDVRFGFSNITCKYKNTAGWSGTRYIYGAQGYREYFQFMMSDSSQEDTTEKTIQIQASLIVPLRIFLEGA